ncbi:MAG: AMP-binding protein, partial [Parahaliea sp.]
MHDLSLLNAGSFAPAHPVATDGQQIHHWPPLMREVTRLRQSLRTPGHLRWGLSDSDTYRFAIGLLALLAEGRDVYLPGDNRAAATEALLAAKAGLLGDFPGRDALPIAGSDDSSAASPGPSVTTQQFQLGGTIVVFTSGSTGQPKALRKTLGQLAAELATLERQWGQRLSGSQIAGTVSHQHFYGLLFRLLWPLCSGRLFWRQTFADPAQFARQMLSAGVQSSWIMSPAHLHRLGDDMPWPALRGRVRAVFSSGGLLNAQAAASVAEGLGQPPFEVLGSSETGGIAWRCQCPGGEAWQALPGVSWRIDDSGALAVRSPMLADDHWYRTADAASEAGDGRFHLLGRLDRIAKIEGLRVALPQVEAALNACPEVIDCAVIARTGQRQSLAAALVLSDAGIDMLARQGLPAL